MQCKNGGETRRFAQHADAEVDEREPSAIAG